EVTRDRVTCSSIDKDPATFFIGNKGSTAGGIGADVVPFHQVARGLGSPGELIEFPDCNPPRDDVAPAGKRIPGGVGVQAADGVVAGVIKDENAASAVSSSYEPRRQGGAGGIGVDVVPLHEIAGHRAVYIAKQHNSASVGCNDVA